MTEEEYEEEYRYALEQIESKKDVDGLPYRVERPARTRGGIRVCKVNGVPCRDREIFQLAWGNIAAAQIMEERARQQGEGT